MSATSPQAGISLTDVANLWWIAVVSGGISLLVGILVLANLETSLATLSVIVGIYLLIAGMAAILHTFAHHDDPRIGPGWLVVGMLSLIAGLVVVRHPEGSVVAVALTIGIYFVVIGALDLAQAILGPRRLMALFKGVLAIAAGTIIIASPDIGVKTLALIIGISLCLQGVVQLLEGFALRT